MAGLVGILAATALIVAPAAVGSDRIYWSNFDIETISYANLDGSGGGDLSTGAATVDGPMGIAIDPAAGRIYWSNWGYDENYVAGGGSTISYANLDGSGGGDLDTGGATVDGPHGLAIDPVAGRIYWPNYGLGSQGNGSTISYANLDGTGGGDLDTGLATVSGPRGVALDPAAGKIYWANYGDGFGTTISYANLDGSGGADLMTVGATVEGPEGVALDPVTNKIFWGNYGTPGHGDTIAYANLDGTGDAHDLSTEGVSPHRVHGVALDKARGKIYWANYASPGGSISSANLDGTGGGANLVTTGASMNGPELPALLEAPKALELPAVSGSTALGSSLSCTPGAWAADALAALLYRAPHEFSYQWTLDGQPILGSTSNSARVSGAGEYRCQVTARNAAGSTTQTSAALAVPVGPDVTAPRTTITERPKRKLRTRKRMFRVEVGFTSEPGASFKCMVDGAPFKPCTSPFTAKVRSKGGKGMIHAISVEAVDPTGNVGKAATVRLRVIRKH